MKTIFITLFQGVEAKNLLRTGVVEKLLKNPDVRVVLFCASADRVEYYQKEFQHPRVVYEVFSNYSSSFFDRSFGQLKFWLIRTKTTNLKRRLEYLETKKISKYIVSQALNWLLARSVVRRTVRFFDFLLVKDVQFAKYFDTYQPAVVFLAHLFSDVEIALLREAKKRGVSTVGFINSWDKLTARSAIRILPDTMLVFNETVKQEAKKYADMPVEKITVVGIPQYDRFFEKKVSKRADFFRKKNLDPNQSLLLYAPVGRTFSNSDWEVVDFLQQAITDGKLSQVQMLVRFQPNDFFDEKEIQKRSWLVYDAPGIRFSEERGVDWDMNESDLKHLTDTLEYSSLVVCYASSLSVDAAVFDKPVININFEFTKKKFSSKSATIYYQTEHYGKALDTGGIKLVDSPDELLQSINNFLAHPEVDREKRQRLVLEQCAFVDGRSAERIAQYILQQAKT